jgi:uncharacterized hydrophobic protein (TIGR00341 family)
MLALRLIELFVPAARGEEVREMLEEHKVTGIWTEPLPEERVMVRVLLQAQETEAVLDLFAEKFSSVEGFSAIMLAVEAYIPRPEPEEKKEPEEESAQNKVKAERVSREELYNDVSDSSKLSGVFIIMVLLSSLVAAIGLSNSNVIVIIGAMVIAPLLGPNVALSLAATLGDRDLAFKSLKTGAAGIAASLALSLLLGILFDIDPASPEIVARTRVGLIDIVLALASGSAGALAFTTGVPAALIGVMVAVAILPPLVTTGMLLGGGFFGPALNALLLLLTNLICVNLSGVITFLFEGIRPVTWWEADRAKKATRVAICIWGWLLAALAAVIMLSQRK